MSDLENRVVHTSTAAENLEIQNIAPSRYLKTTDDGTGFECVEGGGDEGGKTFQNSVKKIRRKLRHRLGRSAKSFEKRHETVQQNAQSSKPNQTHIHVDDAEIENADQLPRADLVNQQITENVFAESNESFIVGDKIEQIVEKLRSRENR